MTAPLHPPKFTVEKGYCSTGKNWMRVGCPHKPKSSAVACGGCFARLYLMLQELSDEFAKPDGRPIEVVARVRDSMKREAESMARAKPGRGKA